MPTNSVNRVLNVPSDEHPTAKQATVMRTQAMTQRPGWRAMSLPSPAMRVTFASDAALFSSVAAVASGAGAGDEGFCTWIAFHSDL